jgi:Family of unknown function (DUF6600)
MRTIAMIGLVLALGVLLGVAPAAAQGTDTPEPQQDSVGRIPPRLSFVDGQVSFWRPGAQDWTQAQVNTPLGPGDQLYTGSPGNLELQIGARAFVRAGANTQLGLESQESDFLQFKLAAGYAAFDVRTLEPGHTLEVDTPNAAFVIEHNGYYRVTISGELTSFITRRGGRATATPASGEAIDIAPSEEVIIGGTPTPQVASFVAPQLDGWDKWNYARTEDLLDAVSARYVPPGVYGANDLDEYGKWRVVPTYGPVWVPTAEPAGWAPYTTGSWVMDPYYGWTWVDTAPWGWAPYHYGRWVSVGGFWAWAPGPVAASPVYAPALVAFFGGSHVSVGIKIGGPVVGWVALGWGEPCVPWWGPSGFRDRPWWGGWHGPRVVNNVVVNNTTVVNVRDIHSYRNMTERNAVVGVKEDHFGRGPIKSGRITRLDPSHLQPIHTPPQVAATPASFGPRENRGVRPSNKILERPVIATRQPHAEAERHVGPAGVAMPAPRVVSVPRQHEPAAALNRAPFGQSKVERQPRPQPPAPPGAKGSPGAERAAKGGPPEVRQVQAPQPSPSGAKVSQRPEGGAKAAPSTAREAQPQPSAPSEAKGSRGAERAAKPTPSVTREAQPQPAAKVAGPQAPAPQAQVRRAKASPALPGEPANRLAPNRAQTSSPQRVERQGPPAGQQGPSPARQTPRGGSERAPEKVPSERQGG